MTKLELREYQWIQRNIKKLRNRLEYIQSLATKNTTQLQRVPIRSLGSTSDIVGNTIAEYAEEITELQQEIMNQLRKACAEENRIERAIQTLPAREMYLIRARYIEMRSWEQIAVDMSYEWAHVHRIHAGALRQLAGKE